MPLRRPTRRDLRLASGLVLFTYLSLHLVDHALGLVSLDAAEAALALAVAIWHSLPGTVLLYGAAATHVALALASIYERRTLRMPPLQGLRIVLGLWLPVLLIAHFTGTRYAFERYGLASDYARVVSNLWAGDAQGRQLALLAPGWIHGCLGIRFAFGTRALYRRALPVLFGAALLLPVLAGLGFLSMGRQLAELAQRTGTPLVVATPLAAERLAELERVREDLLASYFGAIALVLVAREARSIVERRRKSAVAIRYPQRSARVPRGWTVLEASRSHGVPHLSLCGGRARCSTCRVRILEGAEHCPPPEAEEQRTLERLHAGADVRLACQLRPQGDIAVLPLLAPAPAARASSLGALVAANAPPPSTTEREVAILVAGLRRWPRASHAQRSAHDTVYALNLFCETVGDAVEACGGTSCGFAGAWAPLAVFGLRGGTLADACRQAIDAAARIERAVLALNARLAHDVGAQGELSIALHAGGVVVGRIGAREAKSLAALGAAVEVARRLHDAAQDEALGFVASGPLLDAAGVAVASGAWREIEVDGDDDAAQRLRVGAGAASSHCLAAPAALPA
jgi:adenylate cyclase